MLTNVKYILNICLLILLYIVCTWYGRINETLTRHHKDETKYILSYVEANKILMKPISINKKYYYYNITINTYNRTMIPYKYKLESSIDTKKYYSTIK